MVCNVLDWYYLMFFVLIVDFVFGEVVDLDVYVWIRVFLLFFFEGYFVMVLFLLILIE